MKKENNTPQDVDAYMAQVPANAMPQLQQAMQHIAALLPQAELRISYGIPTYKVQGKNIIHVAGYAGHIGLYPGAGALAAHAEALKDYKTSKGTVQLPLDRPLPLELITTLVQWQLDHLLKKK